VPRVEPSAREAEAALVVATTVVVIVEPSFLVLTSTPSIAPSSAEDTWLVSAAGVCAWA